MAVIELVLCIIGIGATALWVLWVSFKPTDQEIARKLEILEAGIGQSLAYERNVREKEVAGAHTRICTLNDRTPSKYDVEYLQRQVDKIASQIENQKRKTR